MSTKCNDDNGRGDDICVTGARVNNLLVNSLATLRLKPDAAKRPLYVQCIEVQCSMSSEFYSQYLQIDNRVQSLLWVMNPNKFRACEYLIRLHESRGDKILVFADNIFALTHYATVFKRPMIHGATSDAERLQFLYRFQHGTEINTLFISKVGDTSLDLPDANVIIQISSHYGSRRQEAQRLGRILRPKSVSSDPQYNAFFYTLVSRDTREVMFAAKRQRFLVDQGYAYKILTELPGLDQMTDLQYSTAEARDELLYRCLAASDSDIEEDDNDDEDAIGINDINDINDTLADIGKTARVKVVKIKSNSMPQTGIVAVDRNSKLYLYPSNRFIDRNKKRNLLFRKRCQQIKSNQSRM